MVIHHHERVFRTPLPPVAFSVIGVSKLQKVYINSRSGLGGRGLRSTLSH